MSLHFTNLVIQNLATIENQDVVFTPKFNVISGETGSGKSLILDAINLILGAKADRGLIRKDADQLTIEATLDISKKHIKEVSSFFLQLGFPIQDGHVLIKRVIAREGKSKVFINYQTALVNDLQVIARRFIDLVGQFENQRLLSSRYQLELLDDFGKHSSDLDSYQLYYKKTSGV